MRKLTTIILILAAVLTVVAMSSARPRTTRNRPSGANARLEKATVKITVKAADLAGNTGSRTVLVFVTK